MILQLFEFIFDFKGIMNFILVFNSFLKVILMKKISILLNIVTNYDSRVQNIKMIK
ncbi:MAG: hypothetical protein MPEBLZ_00271 [Candidatus Methanoperedens nitroreducens]|uniref:Uncharacterized protein n=1 Tax=Candidatus Methanoperedens nitratireducens TaxID=1392998 RepID=A0A0P8CDN1_9EURY|nr:MAG: hypothetical protein MPEBLZ_00271 [Candidatus Methanoperedens sp. BLZ1]